jgi:hypothetical protein
MRVSLILTAMLAAGLAAAQDQQGMGGTGGMGGGGGMGAGGGMDRGGGMGAGGGMGGGMGRMRTPAKFDTFSEKLKLSKDQKEEISTLFDEAQKSAAPMREQLMTGRQVMAQAMIGKKSDDEINKYVQMYAQVAAQMTAIEAKTFTKVCAMLKPNQQKNAPQAFELMAGIFQVGNWRMAR